jgi:serine/threonine-protein kinase
MGRDEVHRTAWASDSYPHPAISCLMPLTALLAIAAVMLFGFQMWQWSLPRDTTVPHVTALPQAEAERELRGAGLVVQVVPQRATSETIPDGSVITATPEAGRRVKTGRIVRLVISSGTAYTVVPDVRELSQGEARARLAEATLSVINDEYVTDEKIPFDRVIAVIPPQGTRIRRNTTVSLKVSEGPKEAPDEGLGRSTTISVTVPADAQAADKVRIDVSDDEGQRTIYEETHNPGEIVTQTVDGKGKMTIEAYFGDKLLLKRKY